MSSPAKDLLDYLEGQGYFTTGAASGWSGWLDQMPERPNSTVTIRDTEGFNTPDFDNNIYYPGVQIIVRDDEYLSAYSKAETIQQDLIALTTLAQGGNTYVRIDQLGDINSLGKDENDRSVLTMNYNIIREI